MGCPYVISTNFDFCCIHSNEVIKKWTFVLFIELCLIELKSAFLFHLSIETTTLNALKAKPSLTGFWESQHLPGLGVSGVRFSPGQQGRAGQPASVPHSRDRAGWGQPGQPQSWAPDTYLGMGTVWDISEWVGGDQDPDTGGPGRRICVAMAPQESVSWPRALLALALGAGMFWGTQHLLFH